MSKASTPAMQPPALTAEALKSMRQLAAEHVALRTQYMALDKIARHLLTSVSTANLDFLRLYNALWLILDVDTLWRVLHTFAAFSSDEIAFPDPPDTLEDDQ